MVQAAACVTEFPKPFPVKPAQEVLEAWAGLGA